MVVVVVAAVVVVVVVVVGGCPLVVRQCLYMGLHEALLSRCIGCSG